MCKTQDTGQQYGSTHDDMAVGRRATDNRAQDDITMMQTMTLVVMSVMT